MVNYSPTRLAFGVLTVGVLTVFLVPRISQTCSLWVTGSHGGPPPAVPPLAKNGLWTWPGPQDGLGRGGLRLKWAKGRFWSKNYEKVKVLRMGLSTVESLSGLQESVFSLFRGLQLYSRKKSKKKIIEFY